MRLTATRMLCSDLVTLEWQSDAGNWRRTIANLEEISPSSASLQTDARIPRLARVRIHFTERPVTEAQPPCELRGKMVSRTYFKGIGHFVEVRFDRDCKWSEKVYRPKHLLNPLALFANRAFELAATRPVFRSAPSRGARRTPRRPSRKRDTAQDRFTPSHIGTPHMPPNHLETSRPTGPLP